MRKESSPKSGGKLVDIPMAVDEVPFTESKATSLVASEETRVARIKVIGVGNAGGNAVNRMIREGIRGVEFIVCNTDLQALEGSRASSKIQLGKNLTQGLGTGGDPEAGRQSVLEDTDKIIEAIEGADMVFITAGLGGGTGTGAGPIIASLATELGALTVAVVTKPFAFEGRHRLRQAEQGLSELRECVDTVITIQNERFLNSVPTGTSFYDSFRLVDDVLFQAVQAISDLITVPGLINVDFADMKTIMEGMGMALMGTGSARGENRSLEATQRAISIPLMEEASIEGAKSLLVNLAGGPNVELAEVNEAMMLIRDAADADAAIAFGVVVDERLTDDIKITLIATNFAAEAGSSRSVQGASAMKTRAYTLDDLRAKFDTLLARMQTPEARRGMKAAFDLSSAQLGRAASTASRRAVEVSLDIPVATSRKRRAR